MGRQGKALIALAISMVVVAPAGAPAKTTRYRHCAALSYGTGGGYYFYESKKVRAHGVPCRIGRKIARVHPEDVIGKGSEPRRFRRYGFVCRGRQTGRTVPFTCTKQRARVTFSWTKE